MTTADQIWDLPDPYAAETWEALGQRWQAEGREWGRRIRYYQRVLKRQQATAGEVKEWHRRIAAALQPTGAEKAGPPRPHSSQYPCPTREATFHTATGLAVHRAHKHGAHAPEHQLVQGATCPHCLKYLWGTPNQCYQALTWRALMLPADAESCQEPVHLRGLNRYEAIQAEGPVQPPEEIQRLAEVKSRQDLEEIDQLLANEGITQHARDTEVPQLELRLTCSTEQWLQGGGGTIADLVEMWVDQLAYGKHGGLCVPPMGKGCAPRPASHLARGPQP